MALLKLKLKSTTPLQFSTYDETIKIQTNKQKCNLNEFLHTCMGILGHH